MRIISGIYKGKTILQPLDKKTRPLKDITKEGVFNILEHSNILNFKIKNSKILDIFSGTGSFGIECLSREAKSVTFVENYLPAASILKKNIVNLNLEKKSFVLINDFTKIIIKEVPIAFFIDNPPNKTNIGIIKNPPPTPINPVNNPIINPIFKEH